MKLNDYQAAANVTLSQKGQMMNLQHCLIGLHTETGEVLDILKKTVFYDSDNYTYNMDKVDVVHLGEELGDCLWYIAVGLFNMSIKGPVSLNSATGSTKDDQFLHVYRRVSVDVDKAIKSVAPPLKGIFIAECIIALNIHSANLLARFNDTHKQTDAIVKDMTTLFAQALEHVVTIACLFKINLDQVATNNIDKLKKRYEKNGGKFDEDCAKFRDLLAEKKILESKPSNS